MCRCFGNNNGRHGNQRSKKVIILAPKNSSRGGKNMLGIISGIVAAAITAGQVVEAATAVSAVAGAVTATAVAVKHAKSSK